MIKTLLHRVALLEKDSINTISQIAQRVTCKVQDSYLMKSTGFSSRDSFVLECQTVVAFSRALVDTKAAINVNHKEFGEIRFLIENPTDQLSIEFLDDVSENKKLDIY